jgi:pyruvate dehydrogenase E2 component (dihydrolipoamide acetyltransferase)
MASKVIMPKLSPTMEEGQIARWLKKEGDKVSMGEPLAEIDTDKATMEMQALSNGVLRKILVNEGESAPLGQLIAVIGEADEDISSVISEAPAKQTAPATAPAPAPAPAPQPAAADANGHARQAPPQSESGRMIVSPLAARMAAEAGLDLRTLHGSGARRANNKTRYRSSTQ